MTISLTAIKPHRYGNTRMAQGDEYKASEKDARLLVAIGKSKLTPRAKKQEKPAEVVPRAQQEKADAADTGAAPGAKARKTIDNTDKPKRRYQRRDMQADKE